MLCPAAVAGREFGSESGRFHHRFGARFAPMKHRRSWLGGSAGHTRVYAYGDSKDDEPLLAYARSTRELS